MLSNSQLELGFNRTNAPRKTQRRQRRLSCSQWWFAQMRAVVEQTLEWEQSGNGQAEQVNLRLSVGRF